MFKRRTGGYSKIIIFTSDDSWEGVTVFMGILLFYWTHNKFPYKSLESGLEESVGTLGSLWKNWCGALQESHFTTWYWMRWT